MFNVFRQRESTEFFPSNIRNIQDNRYEVHYLYYWIYILYLYLGEMKNIFEQFRERNMTSLGVSGFKRGTRNRKIVEEKIKGKS